MQFTRIVALALAGISPLAAATRLWDGGDPVNTNWNDADNWDAVVVAGDDLVFPSGIAVGDKATVNNFTAGTLFRSLSFQDVGYAVTGNAFTLSGAIPRMITVSSGTGTTNVSVPVTLGGDATFSSTSSRSTLRFTQPISLAGHKLTLHAANGAVVLEEDVGATGQLQKTGAGTATIGANSDLTLSFGFNVSEGRLVMNGFTTHSVTVSSNARLAGTGMVGGGDIFGTVEPGGTGFPDYGAIGVTGQMDFNGGSTYAPEIGLGANDKINASGAVNLFNTSTLSPQVPAVIPFPIGASYNVIEKLTGGAISNAFGNAPHNGTVTAGRVTFSVNYQAGNGGNDLVLTVTNIDASGIFRVWDGGGADNKWSTAANWVGDIAPGGGDVLVFPEGAARPVSVNDLPVGFAIAGFTIESGAYQFSGNSFTLTGNIVTFNDDMDLTFGLPFTLYPLGFTYATVSHQGDKALNFDSVMNAANLSTGVQLSNHATAGPGFRFRGTMTSSAGATLVIRDDSPAAFEIDLSAAMGCANVYFIDGDVEIKGANELITTASMLIGDPGGLFGITGGPATVTTSGLGFAVSYISLLQPTSMVIAQSSKLISTSGSTVFHVLPELELRNGAAIENGTGPGSVAFVQLGTVTAGSGVTARIDPLIIQYMGPVEAAISSGGAILITGSIFLFNEVVDFDLTGGGQLRVTGTTAAGEFTVSGDSSLTFGSAGTGSALTNVTLGSNGTPGHLKGSGTVGDVVCTVSGSSISPGLVPSSFGQIICDSLSSTVPGFDFVRNIAGTVPGVSYDQVVVRDSIAYAGLSGNITFNANFAPPSGTFISMIDPDDDCVITGILPDSDFTLLGQNFRQSFAGGDGNDHSITKLAVPPPLMGVAAGLPAPFIQTAVPPALSTYQLPAKGQAGLDYRLEYSTDLNVWTLSPTIYTAPPGGVFTPSFPIAPELTPKLFFRLRAK